jgi:hypothetical protein
MNSDAQAFFDSLSGAQRIALSNLAPLSAEEQENAGKALIAAAVKHCAPPAADLKRKLDTGTGPALEAFGKKAVEFRYISQAELDRIRARIRGLPTEEEREAATVAAMRRFLAFSQPFGLDMVLTGCPLRQEDNPKIDVNGLPASLDSMSGPPSGNPEGYNICVKMPGDDEDDDPSWMMRGVEPKYMRPADPMFDEYAEKIPEDHAAEAWWEAKMHHYETQVKPLLMAMKARKR